MTFPAPPFDPLDDDKPHEECGVFGIYGHADAAPHTVLGLHALQHRGQEATGIVAYDGKQFNAHRDMGLVGDTFSSERELYPGSSSGASPFVGGLRKSW